MNQADVSKLVSKLRIPVAQRHRNLKNPDGPKGRLEKLKKTVTALIKHERIELNFNRADEARGYAERLISDAIRYGDRHNETMKMADFWIVEKQLIHKLFKVLVPRFQDCTLSYTRMLPISQPVGWNFKMSVLELRGNPYPPLLTSHNSENRNLIHNILLDEARKEKRQEQYLETANAIGQGETSASWVAKPSEIPQPPPPSQSTEKTEAP